MLTDIFPRYLHDNGSVFVYTLPLMVQFFINSGKVVLSQIFFEKMSSSNRRIN